MFAVAAGSSFAAQPKAAPAATKGAKKVDTTELTEVKLAPSSDPDSLQARMFRVLEFAHGRLYAASGGAFGHVTREGDTVSLKHAPSELTCRRRATAKGHDYELLLKMPLGQWVRVDSVPQLLFGAFQQAHIRKDEVRSLIAEPPFPGHTKQNLEEPAYQVAGHGGRIVCSSKVFSEKYLCRVDLNGSK